MKNNFKFGFINVYGFFWIVFIYLFLKKIKYINFAEWLKFEIVKKTQVILNQMSCDFKSHSNLELNYLIQ